MKLVLMIAIPVLVVAAAVVGAIAMINARPQVETRPPEVLPPLVRVQAVEFVDHSFTVMSQGTVSPRTESQLVPEVSGRVIEVSPSFIAGGFFEADDVLFKIDASDYKQAVSIARAEVAQRKLRLAQEEAEAAVARKEWADLGEGEATPLTLREPQLADARASLEAAEAALEQAQRDLDRTEVRAPYAGRVRNKSVDLGQFVTRGTPIATLYAVDFAEIRLPLPDNDLAYVDIPLDYRGDKDTNPGPSVTLRADFAGQVFEWQGRIVRTEGEIDPMSRLVHVVAQVDDPYGRGPDPDRPPLAVGVYVRAEIQGREAQNVTVLPRAALHGVNQVWVVDADDRLRFREVSLLRVTRDVIVVESGLEVGERICLSPLEAVTDGMRVRTPDAPKEDAEGNTPIAEGRAS
jgi:RND family efflux transporter MFP subunit